MCYTGLCEWEYSSGPDTGDCSWPGWGSGEKPPCPEPEVEAKERDVREPSTATATGGRSG